jgi:predicted DNA-binding ribbon-helix-helix protein
MSIRNSYKQSSAVFIMDKAVSVVSISSSLERADYVKLDAMARADGLTKAAFIRKLILGHLEINS